MSDREKELAKRIARMPEMLQDKFLEQARGAELALEILAESREAKNGKEETQ